MIALLQKKIGYALKIRLQGEWVGSKKFKILIRYIKSKWSIIQANIGQKYD